MSPYTLWSLIANYWRKGAWWVRKPPWIENKIHSGMQLWALCSQASQQLRDGGLQSGRWTTTSATIYHLWCLHPSVSQSVHLFWEQLLQNFDWLLIQRKLKRGRSGQSAIACVTVAGLQFGSGFHFLLLVHPIPDSPMLDWKLYPSELTLGPLRPSTLRNLSLCAVSFSGGVHSSYHSAIFT